MARIPVAPPTEVRRELTEEDLTRIGWSLPPGLIAEVVVTVVGDHPTDSLSRQVDVRLVVSSDLGELVAAEVPVWEMREPMTEAVATEVKYEDLVAALEDLGIR